MGLNDHRLPIVLIPEGDICVPLFIPNDPDYVKLLVRAIRLLELDRHYERDENHSAIIVREQWSTRTISPLIEALASDNGCTAQENVACDYFPTWHSSIEYIPYNPFSEEDDGLHLDYPIAPFFRFARIDTWFPDWIEDYFFGEIEHATGYRENDVFVSFFSLPTLRNPFNGLDYPTIKIIVNGAGLVRLRLLSVPNGGRALITVDDTPDIGDIFNAVFSPTDKIVELNRDLLAFPPETDLDSIEEIELSENSEHKIYITFLPVINDEIPFFQMGGGFRGLDVCSGVSLIDIDTGLPVDKTEFKPTKGFIMATQDEICAGVICAMEKVATRILLAQDGNIASDIKIDKDSKDGISIITNVLSSGDPVASTSDEAYNGKVYNQALEFKKFFDNINTQDTNGYSATSIISFSQIIINPLDVVAWGVLITNYLASPEVITIDVSKLTEATFCHFSFFAGLLNYALDNHTEAEAVIITDTLAQIPQSTVDDWFLAGENKPRADYFTYACYRLPQSQVIWDVSISQAVIEPTVYVKSDRIWRVSFSGQVTNDLGQTFDGVYLREADDTIVTKTPQILYYRYGGSNAATSPSSVLPSYTANGGYAVYFEAAHTSTQRFLSVWYPSILDAFIASNRTGTITVKVDDLGVL